MKNSKRMLAVIAASGLALGAMPGVASAQSDIIDLDLGTELLGGSVSIGVDLFVGSSGLPDADFPALQGSVEDIQGSGSEGLTGSGDYEPGDILGEIAAGSAGIGGSSEGGSSEGGEGSSEGGEGSSEGGSSEGGEGSSEGGSSEGDGALSSGSLGTDGEGSSGSSEEGEESIFDKIGDWFSELFDGGSSEGGEGSNGSSSNDGTAGDGENPGSLATILGSLSSGSTDEDSPLGSLTGEDGLLDKLVAGSSELGSSAENNGSSDNDIDTVLGSSGGAGSAAGALLGAGSLAAGGIAIGLIVSGGVNLPPLPGIDVAAVCNLPQEGIDFLKGAGSMEPQECLPEEQN